MAKKKRSKAAKSKGKGNATEEGKQRMIYFIGNAVLKKIKFDLPPNVTAEMPFVIHSDATVKELLAVLDESVLGGLLVLDTKTRNVVGAFTTEAKVGKGCRCGGGREGWGSMKKCAKAAGKSNPDCRRLMCSQPTLTQGGEITSCLVTCLDGHLGGSIGSILDQEGPGGDVF
jgi:hypothetical protein